MKVLYVAGPYRARSEWELEQNIDRAAAAALDAWAKGWAVICPHKNTAHFGGACPDHVWLKGDMEFLRRADALLAIDGWLSSVGAQAEVLAAKQAGIPIFYGTAPRPEEVLWPKSKST